MTKYYVQTAIEEIEADTPEEALHIFLNTEQEVIVIVEEKDNMDPSQIMEYKALRRWSLQ